MGYCALKQILDPRNTNICHQGWLIVDNLGFEEDHEASWNGFLFELSRCHIRLKEETNVVIWNKNETTWYYTTRLGYRVL